MASLEASIELSATQLVVVLTEENVSLRRQLETAEARLARIRDWTHRYGAELCPTVGTPDTYGEGVRACKQAVSRLVGEDAEAPHAVAVDPAREVAVRAGEPCTRCFGTGRLPSDRYHTLEMAKR